MIRVDLVRDLPGNVGAHGSASLVTPAWKGAPTGRPADSEVSSARFQWEWRLFSGLGFGGSWQWVLRPSWGQSSPGAPGSRVCSPTRVCRDTQRPRCGLSHAEETTTPRGPVPTQSKSPASTPSPPSPPHESVRFKVGTACAQECQVNKWMQKSERRRMAVQRKGELCGGRWETHCRLSTCYAPGYR